MREIISIEKVLNSRCSCDFDGDPQKEHWGNFVKDKYPSRKILMQVLECCRKTPQFSGEQLTCWFEENQLYTGFKKTDDPFKTHLLHIESGMQHEIVYLACTVLGVGTCIRNLGINGTEHKDKLLTARHLILEKTDSYEAGKFSTAPPGPEKPFKKGRNLGEPNRDGNVDCLPELERLTLFRDTGTHADEADVSQLLWAAKGRTPHYVKSHPWGLTIPTWGGGQDYTNVYLIKKNELFRYRHWTTGFFPFWWKIGKPTHDLKFLKNVKVSSQLDDATVSVILSRNEDTNRALWEVGYMLVNMFLQAKSLGISYKSKFFTTEESSKLERHGISGAVATFLL